MNLFAKIIDRKNKIICEFGANVNQQMRMFNYYLEKNQYYFIIQKYCDPKPINYSNYREFQIDSILCEISYPGTRDELNLINKLKYLKEFPSFKIYRFFDKYGKEQLDKNQF